jgi:N-acetylmuramoyl-L-alanine amidase
MRWTWTNCLDLVLAASLLLNCAETGGSDPALELPAPTESAAPEWRVLPSRAEVVARADTWAVRGAKLTGAAGAEWLQRAADLRARVWRLERRAADGMEAIELYAGAADVAWAGRCEASLRRVLLAGELKDDPDHTYRDLYRASLDADSSACKQKISGVLNVLSAYRPKPSVLAGLEKSSQSPAVAGPPALFKGGDAEEPNQVILPHDQLPSTPARITQVEHYGAKESARVVVFLSHPTRFKVGTLNAGAASPPRLYLDVERADYAGKRSFEVGGLVERVRLGAQTTGTRVVLDLREPVFHRIFYLPEPFRLIIDVSKTAPASETPVSVGKRSIERVVLDPGHGGHDPGAVGPSGLREKDVTLDIAHRAAPLLARELAISTLLTRDTDAFVPLAERTARANAFQADLFISIHCNASEQPGSSGIMTFILDESRDALASQIAARENAASQAAGAELANVMSRVLGTGSVQESLRFAGLLQRAAMSSVLERYPGVKDHGVKRAGFYVLAGAQMPSVLYEASFISNPSGELRLNTGDFRQKMADAIVNAVRAYRDGL